MGQHYIPQYYLNGFSDPSVSSNIWVYQKGKSLPFNSSVKSVANENNRWPEDVEQYLANQVEEPAKFVLDKIRNRQKITQSEKGLLSAYMVFMLLRVPKGLERMKADAPEVMEKVLDNVKGRILKLIDTHPSKASVFHDRLDEIQMLEAKYKNEFPMEVWYNNLTRDSLPRLRELLPTMTWTFLTNDKINPFLTNDNPVFFDEHMGIGKPQSEVSFPISSSIVLWATWHKNVAQGYLVARDTIVREMNRRTASIATKYVYCSFEASWVVRLINKKSFRLNRIM